MGKQLSMEKEFLKCMKIESVSSIYNTFLELKSKLGRLERNSFDFILDKYLFELKETNSLEKSLRSVKKDLYKLTKEERYDILYYVYRLVNLTYRTALRTLTEQEKDKINSYNDLLDEDAIAIRNSIFCDFLFLIICLLFLCSRLMNKDFVSKHGRKMFGVDSLLSKLLDYKGTYREIFENESLVQIVEGMDETAFEGLNKFNADRVLNKVKKELGTSKFISNYLGIVINNIGYILNTYITFCETEHDLVIDNNNFMGDFIFRHLCETHFGMDLNSEVYIPLDILYDILATRKYILPGKGVILYCKYNNKSENNFGYIYVTNYFNSKDEFIIDVTYKDDTEGFIINLTDRTSTIKYSLDVEVLHILLKFFECDFEDKINLNIKGGIDVLSQNTDCVELEAVGVDKNILKGWNIEVFEPYYWKYKGKELSNVNPNLKLKGDSEGTIKINAFTRRLPAGATASSDVKEKAKRYCLKLEEGYTIVSPFERNAKNSKE